MFKQDTKDLPIKVEELGCYKQVVDVLGVTAAKKELFIAMRHTIKHSHILRSSYALGNAFSWGSTPQGYSFWNSICSGLLPPKYEHADVQSS